MNLFTPTRTVIRLDYYGNEYQSTIIGRKLPNKAELWEAFKAMQQQPVLDSRGQHSRVPEEKVNRYWESDLIKQENI